MIDTFGPAFGLLLAAFITPGPNNLIVMGAGSRGGFRHTIPIIFGIILGTVALYFWLCL